MSRPDKAFEPWMNKPRVFKMEGKWKWTWGAIPAFCIETNRWCRNMNEKDQANSAQPQANDAEVQP